MTLLRYRAGSRALARLRDHGFSLDDVRGMVLPATGPRWLIAAGFDRALIRAGFAAAGARDGGGGPQRTAAGSVRRVLLAGSAGAWRAIALAAADPLRAQQALIEGYCAQHFERSHSPAHISGRYRELLASVLRDEDVEHILEHSALALAITTVRAPSPELPAEWAARLDPGLRWLRACGLQARWASAAMAGRLACAAALNLARAGSTERVFERVIFHSPSRADRRDPLLAQLQGRRCELSRANLREVALASGTVPLYMEPVADLEGRGSGRYLDGGLAEYHLNQRLRADGILLMFLHDARIVPGWFDKRLPWRVLGAGGEDVLLIYPDPAFVQSLPGGRVPTRDDFFEFEQTPERRIARWRQCAARSEELGAAFLSDLRAGRIAEAATPLVKSRQARGSGRTDRPAPT